MSTDLVKTLNRQLLELDRLNGTILLSVDVVRALQTTVKNFEGDLNKNSLIKHFCELHDYFMNCKPRMPQIILDTQKTLLHIAEQTHASVAEVKQLLEQNVEDKRKIAEMITKHTSTLLNQNTTLLVHSYSTHLNKTLKALAENNSKPKVIVAEQEDVKTAKILSTLEEYSYEYRVVSEYSASHVLDQIDVAMFGALTLNNNQEIVMAPGSSGLVSDLSRKSIPIYVLLPTEKFSFWLDDYDTTYQETRTKDKFNFTYEKDIFSHDILPLSLFSGIITELGIASPSEIIETFSKLQ
ncbi:MAG: hypothetical protein KDD56_07480, partial [Bdellovibrionales bacterium]|nr:hypothetical protein [Bdellovibrionales bacterium]